MASNENRGFTGDKEKGTLQIVPITNPKRDHWDPNKRYVKKHGAPVDWANRPPPKSKAAKTRAKKKKLNHFFYLGRRRQTAVDQAKQFFDSLKDEDQNPTQERIPIMVDPETGNPMTRKQQKKFERDLAKSMKKALA